jgi:hypothetical protein
MERERFSLKGKTLGQRAGEVIERPICESRTVAFSLAGQQHVQSIVEVVAPLGVLKPDAASIRSTWRPASCEPTVSASSVRKMPVGGAE